MVDRALIVRALIVSVCMRAAVCVYVLQCVVCVVWVYVGVCEGVWCVSVYVCGVCGVCVCLDTGRRSCQVGCPGWPLLGRSVSRHLLGGRAVGGQADLITSSWVHWHNNHL